ncbi:MAG: hypothetical protein ABMA15_08090 [Vicinamibacterales bacterium]
MRCTTAFLFSSIVLLAACSSLSGEPMVPAGQTSALETPFTLKPAETATVGQDRVQVRFDRVVADSRCPRDVQCITAGEATVRVLVTVPGQQASAFELTTTPKGSIVKTGAYALTLSGLAPVPLSTTPTKDSDYRATFVLAKAS